MHAASRANINILNLSHFVLRSFVLRISHTIHSTSSSVSGLELIHFHLHKTSFYKTTLLAKHIEQAYAARSSSR